MLGLGKVFNNNDYTPLGSTRATETKK